MTAEEFIATIREYEFGPFTGVPCSTLGPLIRVLEGLGEKEHLTASSEGEAMGVAGGLALAGRTPVVYMQNDGFGNAVNPITSLQLLYGLPCLLLISWRGRPGLPDAPQHLVMGQTIDRLLDLFKIPWQELKPRAEKVRDAVKWAWDTIAHSSLPCALIIPRGFFPSKTPYNKSNDTDLELRMTYLQRLAQCTGNKDVFIGTTGFCGREMETLYTARARFYMMGSMGCALSISLGLARERPDRSVFCLDGDGAVLMKMGTLATVGYYKPPNLCHICFDNRMYESTGGQKTTSENCDLAEVAQACGYGKSHLVRCLRDFEDRIHSFTHDTGPLFLHVLVRSGSRQDLARPASSPEQMRDALMGNLSKG
jgi:phosphonopyruvate decarboxylase